ncbi:polyprenyl synthetase family protein [Streptomyces sp. NPDC050264]|uniref:polyprenyl synthetase family protein n=1 Tax=Streptomyces sp. NPDC050264 TaxID=3155038 RepID=UPI003440ABD9
MAHSNSTLTDSTSADSAQAAEPYRAMVRPALREVVGRLHPDVVRAAAGDCGHPDAENERGLRPALALLSAEAVGGRARDAVPGAVAVELAHLFARTHRGITGAGPVRGVGPAVLAGDGFLALALRTLADSTSISLLSSALVDLVHGEASTTALHGRPVDGAGAVTVDAYTAAAARARGVLLGCAAGIGARLGGAHPDAVCRLTVAGRELGHALHAADDLAALRRGCPRPLSYPVLYALEADDGTARELAALLARAQSTHGGAELDAATARQVADLAVRGGGAARTSRTVRRRLDAVLRTVEAVSVAPSAAGRLTTLVRSAVERAH